MANSRSNIYPVKLQGAELNLNKFDAEIKQYSGFNKNNSPFVGGCLSNLFTKTEENTTGSSDSVYVDDNGDVYTVDAEGFYKNGIKVIKPENETFETWEVEELSHFPSNVVYFRKYNDDWFYITLEKSDSSHLQDYYKLHFRDNVYEILSPVYNFPIINALFDTELSVSGDFIIIAVKMFISVGELRVYIQALNYDLNNNQFMLKKEGRFSVTGKNYDCPPSVINFNQTYIFFNVCGDPATGTTHRYRVSEEGGEIENNGYDIYYNGSTSYAVMWSTELKDWFICKKTKKAYLINAGSYTVPANSYIRFILAGDMTSSLNISSESILSGQYGGTSAVTISNCKMGAINNQYVLSNNGVSYALKASDNKMIAGICDYMTQNVTLADNEEGTKDAMLYMGAIGDGKLLINNGNVSGVSLPGGKILVTEWNSVNKNYIFFETDGILYKDINTDKVLRIFKTSNSPKIKKINNQLVLNINQIDNSYRLSDGRVLMFAPAWNNRSFDFGWLGVNFETPKTDNSDYMATSINEYALKDNASIILNPLPVVNSNVSNQNVYTDNFILDNDLNKNIINIYTGSEAEILYKASITFNDLSGGEHNLVYNSQLSGLPFPLDTNGNVQLSPSLFCKTERFGNDVFIKEGSNAYQLIKDGAESVMSYYLGTLIENLEDIFILQGQYYAIINKQIFNVQFSGGVVQSLSFVVSVENLQFCGNSAYQAYFFSKTNRCIYVFTGANILNQLQLVDKISEIYAYKYNQSTQSIILITDIGTIVSSNLGMYLIEGFTPDDVFFYDKGVVFVSDSEFTYLQYYEADGFEKHNIEVETCFYGMNNETVTINDCLYFRLFSEEHEEGEVKVSATTISLKGRKTETTVFKFKASDWDAVTHSVYVRYQPKEQRGLGISFSINSPFKIASLSVGSKADAILVDKVSKGAVITPSNNDEW